MFTKAILGLTIAATVGLSGAPSAFAAGMNATQAVYAASNSIDGNKVLIYNRHLDGTLSPSGEISTGGNGSGTGLGNQSGLVLTDNGRTMLVVNAGSNEVSTLTLHRGEWAVTGKVNSGGIKPVSITVHNNLVYVLNAGSDSISGFKMHQGALFPIDNSARHLSGSATAPAQISFNPAGKVLLVTEKATNNIDTYTVSNDGTTTGPIVQHSNGATPFGFAFDKHGRAIVSEAFGGTASALSSYNVENNGDISTISASVDAVGQKAACWVVITRNGKFAFTTNTASDTISSYSIHSDGSLKLISNIAAVTESEPTDISLSKNNDYLYVRNSGDNSIQVFKVGKLNGDLSLLQTLEGLPSGANGLASK